MQAVNELFQGALGAGGVPGLPSLPIPDGFLLNAPLRVLVVPPHPDDECLMAGYALRMKEEWSAEVSVLCFSFGSKPERRNERKQELEASVNTLGFSSLQRMNLEKISKSELLDAITLMKPHVVFTPHADDGHETHVETHRLVRECMSQYLNRHTDEKILWVQSEFWRDMKSPNILIPYSSAHVAK